VVGVDGPPHAIRAVHAKTRRERMARA
jgi:hypothetical protein